MTNDVAVEHEALSDTIHDTIKRYLDSIPHDKISNLHEMLLEQIEPPLFQAVMTHCKYNQSRAARLLGLSRGTCRMKLLKYFDEQYCGHRESQDTL